MKIMYRLDQQGNIREIEVIKETAKKVVYSIGGTGTQSEWKRSECVSWHETWKEAHACLVARCERAVASARLHLEIVKGRLGQVRGMRQP